MRHGQSNASKVIQWAAEDEKDAKNAALNEEGIVKKATTILFNIMHFQLEVDNTITRLAFQRNERTQLLRETRAAGASIGVLFVPNLIAQQRKRSEEIYGRRRDPPALRLP